MLSRHCGCRVRPVMQPESIDNLAGSVIHTHHVDLNAGTAIFEDHFIERADSGDIPEMRMADVNHHFADRFAEIKIIDKTIGRSEKQLTIHPDKYAFRRPAGFARPGSVPL